MEDNFVAEEKVASVLTGRPSRNDRSQPKVEGDFPHGGELL